MIRHRLILLLGGTPPAANLAPGLPPELPPALDPEGVKAFAEQTRWVYALHDKRSDTFGQRASTVLAFDGALLSALVAGLVAVKRNLDFTDWIVVNVAVLIALPVLSSLACMRAISPRRVVIPATSKLREQWAGFLRSDPKSHPPAQIVHSFLGGEQDPLASAAKEAKSRALCFKWSLRLLVAAVLAIGVLALQVLRQLT